LREICNHEYCAFCAQALCRRSRKVRSLIAPARKGKNVGAVHDLRVASRRLRSALSLLGPCHPDSQTWRRQVRKLTRRLGQARDLDVQLAYLTRQAQKSPTNRQGLEDLLARLRRGRQAAQEKLLAVLKRLRPTELLADMERRLCPPRLRAERSVLGVEGYRQAAGHIGLLLEDLLCYAPHVANPQAMRQHHRMRIAAKHLRYALEILQPLYGRSLRRAISAARQLQSLLGELHDCDVWLEFLPDYLARLGGRGHVRRAAQAGAAVGELMRDRQSRREALYRRFVALWIDLETKRVWPNLQKTLAKAPLEYRGRRPARPSP
jgi:CHAD domain-containing protein